MPASFAKLAIVRRVLLVVAEGPSAKVGLLEREGWAVRAFRNSDGALHAFNTGTHFDVLITDRAPIGSPGLLLLASLRERGFTGPAILLAENITISESAEAERLGVARILHKPFSHESLLLALRETLSPSETHNQNQNENQT
mgnify:CR=1 FL=1